MKIIENVNVTINTNQPSLKSSVNVPDTNVKAKIQIPAIEYENDYDKLSNIPTINGVEVKGNKNIEDFDVHTSQLINDGDGSSPFATEDYVEQNGGKIDKILLNNEEQAIINKAVNLTIDKTTVGLDKVDNTSDKDKPVSDAVQLELNSINTNLSSTQTDLSSFKEETNRNISDINSTITSEVTRINQELQTTTTNINTLDGKVDNHINNQGNPHNVTKEQIGLGNVDNTSDVDKPVSTLQKEAIDKVQLNLNEHINNYENPHNVTKTQIGLSNVDNTSDLNKPISTQTQTALDGLNQTITNNFNNLNSSIENETERATLAETEISTKLQQEMNTRVQEHAEIQGKISAINSKIPNQASSTNQLADKDFVNSTINSSAAFFKGSFKSKAALDAVQWQTTDSSLENYVTNNDYAYIEADETHNNEAWRYIYVKNNTVSEWQPQFRVNESPFTQAQLDAINSGATADLINSIGSKLTQDAIVDNTGDSSTKAISQRAATLGINTVQSNLNTHILDKNNPHQITKAQIGLSNVDNTSDLDKPISILTQQALNNLETTLTDNIVSVSENLMFHAENTNNPHAVTKAQVGLSEVDNTSDKNKPISDATQTALNDKASLTKPNVFGPVLNTIPLISTGGILHNLPNGTTSSVILFDDDVPEIQIGNGLTNIKFYGKDSHITYNSHNIALDTDLNDKIDKSGGTMTGALYFDNNKFIKGYTTTSTLRNLIGVNSSSDIELGDTGANITVKAASAFRPASNNATGLGTSELQWKEIHGTTIYQSGKQVANAENLSAVTDATLSSDSKILTITKRDGTSFDFKGGSDITSIDGLAGGNLTSNISVNNKAKMTTEGYVVGTWLQTTNTTDIGNSNWADVYVNHNGWLYKRNKSDFINDLGFNNYVPITRTINDKALSSNISLNNKDIGALPDYTITISHQSAGNPRMVKFVSVNYASAATCFKMGAMTCHDNGVSYQFLTDMLIAVTTGGEVTANIYKFAQTSIGNVDGIARYTGDVFYINDTTNKIVDFYILCGQWSVSQFTPVTKVGSTTIAYVTQYSGNANYYSSGDKVWVNGCGTTYARLSDIPTNYVTTATYSTEAEALAASQADPNKLCFY